VLDTLGDRSELACLTSPVPDVAPNVLLLVMDAARRDALTPYGAPASATPAIAELARRGHAIPLAYATGSWTLPSHASMFTGLLPGRLGLGQPPAGHPASARPRLERFEQRLLPRVLGRAGYRCEGFSANLWASQEPGFDIGFDAFTYSASERVARNDTLLGGGARARLAWALEGARARTDDGAAALGRSLRSSIARWSGQPTFWFVNLVECHSPYLPPRPWNDLGPRDRIGAALDSQRHLNFASICLHGAGHGHVPEESMQRMRHLYGRAISYMDAWLADVLGALRERGILDDTLVIVTSDHGESFGEHGLLAHGFSLGEHLIHVPVVMAGPGARDSESAVSLAKLPAWIAQAAGIDSHPYLETDLPAEAVIAQYEPMCGPEDPRAQSFARMWNLDAEAVRKLTTGLSCATDGRHKLVVDDTGRESLYDLLADPDERSPAPAPADGPAASLRAVLDQAAIEEARLEPAPEPTAAPASAASADELAALERQLKLLGYM